MISVVDLYGLRGTLVLCLDAEVHLFFRKTPKLLSCCLESPVSKTKLEHLRYTDMHHKIHVFCHPAPKTAIFLKRL